MTLNIGVQGNGHPPVLGTGTSGFDSRDPDHEEWHDNVY